MSSESGWRTLLGPFTLLIIVFLMYFVRYPMWRCFVYVEPLFLMLISSYFVVLLLSLFFLKKDSKRSLAEVFRINSRTGILVGIISALLFQSIWFLISLGMGSRLEIMSFSVLKGYESYAVYSIFLGFALYLVFAIFGAFAEEVAYRGYVQSRIASRHGRIVAIFVATLFFSLGHIHIFELNWMEQFFQNQFVYVFCFGIFVGYLFFKSKEDIWSVFAFHALNNIFNVTLPIQVTVTFPLANQFATIISFILIIALLKSFKF